jgi:hypothetical protein
MSSSPSDIVQFVTSEGTPIGPLKQVDKLMYLDNVLTQLKNTLRQIQNSEDDNKISAAFLRTEVSIDDMIEQICNLPASIADDSAEEFQAKMRSLGMNINGTLALYANKMNDYERMSIYRVRKIMFQFFEQLLGTQAAVVTVNTVVAQPAAQPAASIIRSTETIYGVPNFAKRSIPIGSFQEQRVTFASPASM